MIGVVINLTANQPIYSVLFLSVLMGVSSFFLPLNVVKYGAVLQTTPYEVQKCPTGIALDFQTVFAEFLKLFLTEGSRDCYTQLR